MTAQEAAEWVRNESDSVPAAVCIVAMYAAIALVFLLAGCESCGHIDDTAPYITPPVHGAEDLDAGEDAGDDDAGHRAWREFVTSRSVRP